MNFACWLSENASGSGRECLVGHRTSPLSHVELWGNVRALASKLAARGRGRSYLVLEANGPAFVTGYLATILSGNVAVPLESRVDPGELAAIAESVEAAGAFLDAASTARVRALDGVPIVDTAPAAVAAPLPDDAGDDELAAILFTSGTTGGRKGVMLSHGNLRSNTESILGYLELGPEDRMLVTLPFAYCYGASWLHTHLRVGASLALSNPISLGAVPAEIDRHGCTGFAGVPSTYQILARKTDFLERQFPTLRYLAQAGGKLPDATIERYVRAFPDKRFYVMYGATEATARLSFLPPELVLDKLGSIGRGIPGVRLEVRDAAGRPVGVGETGEIVASGPNVMLGYWRDPQGTAEVLRDGVLHTGDLATVDRDGFLTVVGRAKRIIKSAGHRISPVRVEETILALERIHDCCVLGTPDELLGEAVVAVVQADDPDPELRRSILDHCRSRLPSFMLPQRLEFVDALPLNPSSKVDLARVREMIERGG